MTNRYGPFQRLMPCPFRCWVAARLKACPDTNLYAQIELLGVRRVTAKEISIAPLSKREIAVHLRFGTKCGWAL
jgi:hypothetical protein